MLDRRAAGDFEAIDRLERRDLGRPSRPVVLPRQLALAVRRRSPASRSRRATGSAGRNPELDKIIEQIRTIGFDDPKGIELGQDYVKLAVREMPTIPLMSYNVFTVMDDDLLDRIPERRDRALHRSGAELGQHAST